MYADDELVDGLADGLVLIKTISKAISRGQIRLTEQDTEDHQTNREEERYDYLRAKSSRRIMDNNTLMDKPCSNAVERIVSAVKGKEVAKDFSKQVDLSHAGALLSWRC